MFLHFLRLEWKAFTRSASLGQEIAMRIFLGFLGLYMLASCLALGFALYPILQKVLPEQKPMQVVNSFVLFWILMELAMRFFMQTLPVMNIKPLMVVPVKRQSIIHFVLVKSIYSFYNTLGLLIFVPFALICVKKGDLSQSEAAGWIVAITGILLTVNFTNFLLKKKFSDDIKGLLPYLLVVVLLFALEYFKIFSSSEVAGRGMEYILQRPFLSALPVLAAAGLYFWNYRTLKEKFYLDASLKSKTREARAIDLSWADRFGSLAPFIKLDMKMILRNKRPRATVIMSVLLLAYGLIFYTNKTYNDLPAFLVFVGVFMTGIFMINFGQFIPAWDSGYYPLMMAQNIPLREYLRSKAGLMYLSVVVLFLGTLPYVYFGIHIVFLNLAAALYNAGINIPVLLFAGSFNKKRIDLEKSVFMNYQGTGATQWIVALPTMIIPILIWYIAYKVGNQLIANLVLGGIGLGGLLLQGRISDFIARAYKERKYRTIEGFKQQAS